MSLSRGQPRGGSLQRESKAAGFDQSRESPKGSPWQSLIAGVPKGRGSQTVPREAELGQRECKAGGSPQLFKAAGRGRASLEGHPMGRESQIVPREAELGQRESKAGGSPD